MALDRCFLCRNHYLNTSQESIIGLMSTWSCAGNNNNPPHMLIFLLCKCNAVEHAGGNEPPRECLSRNFQQSADGSRCVCTPGMYPVGLDCVLCPVGYMCPNGTRVQCPMHYHQPAEGATSCVKCSTTGDRNGFYKCWREGRLLQFCDPAVAGTQDKDLQLNCVPCNQCSRFYTGETSVDLRECYRDN